MKATGRQRSRRKYSGAGLAVSVMTALLAALTLALSACGVNTGVNADGERNYRWKMTITVGSTSTWYLAAERFAERLSQDTEGRITVKIFTSERLSAGEATAGVEQLMDGNKDLSYNSPIIYAGVDPKFGAVTAPFAFRDEAEGYESLQGPGGQAYRELLSSHGVELLGFGESGMRQLTNSDVDVRGPEDLAGMKLRIPGFGLYTDFYRALGADPTTMPFSEVFTALQQGAIDGQENPIDVIYTSSLQEVQGYLTMWNYSYDPLILGMNRDLYGSLSAADQRLVRSAAKDANEFQVEQNRTNTESQLQELSQAMTVTELDEAQIESFKKDLAPLYEQYRGIWGPELSALFIPEGA